IRRQSRRGIRTTIFVPSITSPAKLECIRSYGAELIVGGERYADALQASEEFVARSGALAIHAYDQLETMHGHGPGGSESAAEAIREAQRTLWEALRIAAEPGGAAALAALTSGRYRAAPGERIGVLLCGANTSAVDFDRPAG